MRRPQRIVVTRLRRWGKRNLTRVLLRHRYRERA
jgi:hypothetical protein